MRNVDKKKVGQHNSDKVELKRNINIIQGISIIVGVIIGSGIFVSPVGVMVYTKSVGSSFVMWTMTGLFSTLGAIVYAELGVTIPKSGGEYIYILECFGPLPAFLCLWITFTIIGAASCAANSLIFAEYVIKPFFFTCESPITPIRIIAILGLSCKMFALFLIVGFGAAYLVKGNVSSFKNSFEGSATSPCDYALAFYQGFWAFSGWNYLNFLTGEVKNPAKNMPIMIIISLGLVTAIYLLANVAYLAVLSPIEMLASGDGSSAVALYALVAKIPFDLTRAWPFLARIAMRNVDKKKVGQHNSDKVELKRNINIIQGISIIVGVIIGSGIFVSPVGVMVYTKSVGSSFVMWTMTGLFSTLGAIVYAELGVTIPKSGGEYIYILECFGPLPAFLCLWITFTIIGAASCAANSLIFAEYVIKPFFFTCESPITPIRIIAILGLSCKMFALFLIVGFGAAYLAKGNVSSFKNSFEGSATSPCDYALAFYQGFWAFSGWNYLNFLTGEVKNPAKNMPIMIIISLGLVTAIYLLANVAYLAVLSPIEMLASGDGSSAVALTFAERSMGMMYWVMPIFVGASVFGSINSEVLSLSRLTFTAAEMGHMPTIFSMVNVNKLTPIPSVLLVVMLAVCFQLHPDIFYLIELTGMAFTVISSMAICSLLKIRRTDPNRNKSGFKLPIAFPIVFLLVNLGIGFLAVYGSPVESLLSLGMMAMGVPVYWVGVAWTKKPLVVVHGMYKLTVGMQKLFFVVPSERVKEEEIEVLSSDAMEMDDAYQTWSSPPTP